MTYSTVLPYGQQFRERFHKTVKALPEQDLSLQLGNHQSGLCFITQRKWSICSLNGFSVRSIPEEIAKPSLTSIEELVELLRQHQMTSH